MYVAEYVDLGLSKSIQYPVIIMHLNTIYSNSI